MLCHFRRIHFKKTPNTYMFFFVRLCVTCPIKISLYLREVAKNIKNCICKNIKNCKNCKYIKIVKISKKTFAKVQIILTNFLHTQFSMFLGHSPCLLKKFRLLEYNESLVTFNRNSLYCQTTAKIFSTLLGSFWGSFLTWNCNSPEIHLQFTCSVKHCDFLIRNKTTYLILSPWNIFWTI